MPNVADPTNIRRITSLISQRGSGTVNSAKFRISEMQRSLRRQDVNQREILQQLAEHKGLALLTSRADPVGHFATLHHFNLESSAAAGGDVTPPTVYCGLGTESALVGELRVHERSDGPRWPALQRSGNPIQIPSLWTILALSPEDLDVDDPADLPEGTVAFSPAYFLILNGRALEAVESLPEPETVLSLLRGLINLARADLTSSYKESFPGNDDPTLADLVAHCEDDEEKVPYGSQIQSAFAWFAGHCTPARGEGSIVKVTSNPGPRLREMKEQLQLERAPATPTKNHKPKAATSPKPFERKAPPEVAITDGDAHQNTDQVQGFQVGEEVLVNYFGEPRFGTFAGPSEQGSPSSPRYRIKVKVDGQGVYIDATRSELRTCSRSPARKRPSDDPPARDPPKRRRRSPRIDEAAQVEDRKGASKGARKFSMGEFLGASEKHGVSFGDTTGPTDEDGRTGWNDDNPYRQGAGATSRPAGNGGEPQRQTQQGSDVSGLMRQLLTQAIAPRTGANTGGAAGGPPAPQTNELTVLAATLLAQQTSEQTNIMRSLVDTSARQAQAMEEANLAHERSRDERRRDTAHVDESTKEALKNASTTSGLTAAPSITVLLGQLLGVKQRDRARNMAEAAVRRNSAAPGAVVAGVNRKRLDVYLNDAGTDALTSGRLLARGSAGGEPTFLGFYSISHAAHPNVRKPTVVTSVYGLMKTSEAVVETFKPVFGDSATVTVFARDAHEKIVNLETDIASAMINYNLPALPALIQWELDRVLGFFYESCVDGSINPSFLQLAELFRRITSSPKTLVPPVKVEAIINAAITSAAPAPPPPPARQQPYQQPPPNFQQQPPPPAPRNYYQPQPPPAHFQNYYQPPPRQPDPYQQRGQPQGPPAVHKNQPAALRCSRDFYREVVHKFGIELLGRDPSVRCPRLDDGKEDCLRFAIRGICDGDYWRADPRQGGSILAHQPVVEGSTRCRNLVQF